MPFQKWQGGLPKCTHRESFSLQEYFTVRGFHYSKVVCSCAGVIRLSPWGVLPTRSTHGNIYRSL